MTADSWHERERKQYLDDPTEWFKTFFRKRLDRQVEQTRDHIENAAESVTRKLMRTHDSLILWMGLMATVALASAGLWIGVGGLGLVLVWVWRASLSREKRLWRFDYFRDVYFHELVKYAEFGIGLHGKMLECERKEIQKWENGILFPLTTRTVGPQDLERIEILYREYCGFTHVDAVYEGCGLCAARAHLREHIKGVISKFESQTGFARADLISRIDGRDSDAEIHVTNFLEKYRNWERGRSPDSWGTALRRAESESRKRMLETLRNKENWTFEEGDTVRELCRIEKGYDGDDTSLSGEFVSAEVFDVLTREMEAAAKRCGFEEAWEFYNANRNWLWDWWEGGVKRPFPSLRQVLERGNPETTFRELVHIDGSLKSEFLNWNLKSYGFDREMCEMKLKAGWKLVRKNIRERKREQFAFAAAREVFWHRQAEKEQGAGWPGGS
jgi:hypothetical protein